MEMYLCNNLKPSVKLLDVYGVYRLGDSCHSQSGGKTQHTPKRPMANGHLLLFLSSAVAFVTFHKLIQEPNNCGHDFQNSILLSQLTSFMNITVR